MSRIEAMYLLYEALLRQTVVRITELFYEVHTFQTAAVIPIV